MTADSRVVDALDRISYSQPYAIIESLEELTEKQLELLYAGLKEPENQATLAQLMYFQKYLDKFMPEVSRTPG
ncbi:hypothetical protein HYU11_01850 [Candidatus Woesearchaeota archaeon]|nr:hypothetical protein [Candidatus Woesearchaeota archaeon]